MIFPVSNKVHKMYKPLKASVFCCVYDAGSSLRGEKHTICAFGLEIGVHQHFNQMISNYIFGVLQQALKWTRSALQIPEPQPLVLWTWWKLCYSASASVIYLFVFMNTISRKQQKHKEPFLGWHTSLQTLWNGNNLYATFLFNQPSVVPWKCITGNYDNYVPQDSSCCTSYSFNALGEHKGF